MRFDIITIFPKIFDSYFNESILKRAQARKLVAIRAHVIRKFSKDKHKKVDDKPYGGGAGMVLQAAPILRAVESVLKIKNQKQKIKTTGEKVKIILLSAKGKQFTQKMAYDWAKKNDRLVLISGRYEGVDERAKIALRNFARFFRDKKNVVFTTDRRYKRQSSLAPSVSLVFPTSFEEISIGPYVLTDGDAAAMVIVSAVARLIPGVIAHESLKEESFSMKLKAKSWKLEAMQTEYPHYTRPEVFEWQGKKYRVPKVLLSGDHKKIEEWRARHRS